MAFPVSPGFNIQEIDLTAVVSEATTTPSALAGVFRWGPMLTPINVAQENPDLLKRFGSPTNFNAETWFTMANFLAYANSGIICRGGKLDGNTVSKSFTGNSTNLAATQNSATVQVGNTSSLNVGMLVFYSNATGVFSGSNTSITSIVNATHITLSSAATANVQAVNLIFRDNALYSAVAQEVISNNIPWDLQIVANNSVYNTAFATFDSSVNFIARYPGEMGNSLRIAVCDTAAQFSSNVNLQPNALFDSTLSVITANVGSNVVTVTVAPANTANATMVTAANLVAGQALADLQIGDKIEVGNVQIGFQILETTALGTVQQTGNVFSFTINVLNAYRLQGNVSSNTIERFWEFYNAFGEGAQPGQSTYQLQFGNTAANDEMHIVVVDDGVKFTGVDGEILEVFGFVSRATDAVGEDGGTNYYKNILIQNSQYIWPANDRTTAASNTAQFLLSSTASAPLDVNMYGGADGKDEKTVSIGYIMSAFDQFKSAEDIDVALLMAGKARGSVIDANTDIGNYIIQNIAEIRKDCIALVSPDVNIVVGNYGFQVSGMVNAVAVMPSSSYGTLDSGYKYQYDRYNDIYRWIPLNGDCAGLAARTDQTNDPWWSYAGFRRGQIKNVVKLAFNPKQADRDILYPHAINPVVTFPGQGTVLFGNKTLLNTTSAFSRVNVRRLFIVLEKAISSAAKQFLFEFNDDFTRAQFKAMVVPYLHTVKARRGIYDFLVVCDATNNTPDIIDNNQFVGDIYIKPARTIEFGLLRFIAVATGVAFSEVVGKF